MVILNIEKVNNLEEMISKYENILNIQNFKCSKCDHNKFTYYGYYKRNIVYIDEHENVLETKIKLKKLKCKNCGMIHSVIPSFLIPYRQYSLESINKIIEEKIERKVSDRELNKKYNISRQLIKKWIDAFLNLKNKLCTLYRRKEKIIECVNNDKIIDSFYIEFKQIYLLKRITKIYVHIST